MPCSNSPELARTCQRARSARAKLRVAYAHQTRHRTLSLPGALEHEGRARKRSRSPNHQRPPPGDPARGVPRAVPQRSEDCLSTEPPVRGCQPRRLSLPRPPPGALEHEGRAPRAVPQRSENCLSTEYAPHAQERCRESAAQRPSSPSPPKASRNQARRACRPRAVPHLPPFPWRKAPAATTPRLNPPSQCPPSRGQSRQACCRAGSCGRAQSTRLPQPRAQQ